MQCQYMNPRTGEHCGEAAVGYIIAGPVRVPVCGPKHGKAMSPGGRNRTELQRSAEWWEKHARHRAEGNKARVRSNEGRDVREFTARPQPRLTWPKVEQEQGA
jgi:hypothetical protein